MAINLLSNNHYNVQNNLDDAMASSQVESGRSLMRQAATAMLSELRDMMPGDVLAGQLVSKDGSNIQLLLSNNTLLNTVLDNDVNIAMGQQISFEVRSNQNGQLTLRPMFTNLNNSSTIMNALDAANIAASDASIELVDTLMQNGMSIGKEMLNTINRELTMYPEADTRDIVMLHKMDIPVNADNVHQMHLYNNNNQWMMENVSDSAAELTDLLADIASQGGEAADNILKGISDMLKPSVVPDDTANIKVADGLEGNESRAESATGAVTEADTKNISLAENTDQSKASVSVANANVNDLAANKELAEGINREETDGTKLPQKDEQEANNSIINKFNVFEKIATLSKEELSNPIVKSQIKNAVNELLKDNFLMDPKSVGEEKYVKKYYDNTMNLADNLSRLLAENGKADTPFAQTMNNVKENTSFMNQINELYNYVQLPLKMNDSHANGDLYVYARKKGRGTGGEDGKLTALLHLSMEHLGNMDIFLTLQDGQKLSTRFCLEDESLIDFIASHIDELNKRLADKGYDVGVTSITGNEDSTRNVIEKITEGDGSSILLSTQSFDARA